MKTDFSKTWNKSKQPRKQRKFRYNAPLHIRSMFLHINLSKELRKKYGVRAIRARTGDKVKVMRGTYKKKDGKIEEASAKDTKIYITNINFTKKDGSKTRVPFQPSNLQIVELNADDKKRMVKLKNSKKNESETKKESKSENKSEVKNDKESS